MSISIKFVGDIDDIENLSEADLRSIILRMARHAKSHENCDTAEDVRFQDDSPELTEGQKLMGVMFNPTSDVNVAKCKQDFASIADNLLDLANQDDATPQIKRMVALGLTRLQEAQMWTVKALTWDHEI